VEEYAETQNEHSNHLMALAQNLDQNNKEKDYLYPLLIGSNVTEILFEGQWREYRQLPKTWLATECLIQRGHFVYQMSESSIFVLDLKTWKIDYLGEIPQMGSMGKCTFLYVEGSPGNNLIT